MSRTLLLNDTLWASAKALATVGRRADAVARVESLLSRPDLSASVEADARRLAAELLIDSEMYPEARRHLSAAAELQPGHAHTQYLLGLAHECDPLGEPRKAAARFRRAAELAPANAAYRAAYGRAAVRGDRPKAGVKALLAAADSDDPAVARVVVEGLTEAGKRKAARRVLAKAMFLHPRDRDLKTLWDRVRFDAALSRQWHTRRAQDAQLATEGDVAVLPFIRIVREGEEKVATAAGGTIRRDLVSRPRPHLPRLRVTRADR